MKLFLVRPKTDPWEETSDRVVAAEDEAGAREAYDLYADGPILRIAEIIAPTQSGVLDGYGTWLSATDLYNSQYNVNRRNNPED